MEDDLEVHSWCMLTRCGNEIRLDAFGTQSLITNMPISIQLPLQMKLGTDAHSQISTILQDVEIVVNLS